MGIAENLHEVLQNIDKAAHGRPVKLIAVTKTVEPERVNEAIAAGAKCIGENRVQELLGREEKLLPVEKHLIGTLQTNKARQIAGHVALIHSVDREALAVELDKISCKKNIISDILIQVNIGREQSKGGVLEEDLFKLLDCISGLSHVRAKGFMCVPPICKGDQARSYFAATRELMLRAASAYGNLGLCELSMGMSGDYAEAIKEGATMVRVGSAIFGKRYYNIHS